MSGPALIRHRLGVIAIMAAAAISALSAQVDFDYLSWTRQQAEAVGRSMRVDGRVGGLLDLRVIRTERSFNYKLRATLLTPEVIRATARLHQLAGALTDPEATAIVTEAEHAGDLVVLLEIDPREGSGVLPPDIAVLLRQKDGDEEGAIRGTLAPELRKIRGLAGTFRRDYAYEQLWVVFDLQGSSNATALITGEAEAEVAVRIHDKEGRVSWRLPMSVRQRMPSSP